jgi:hypothetical protein
MQCKPRSGYITQKDLIHLEKTRREVFLDWDKAKKVLKRLREVKSTESDVGILEPISAIPDKEKFN